MRIAKTVKAPYNKEVLKLVNMQVYTTNYVVLFFLFNKSKLPYKKLE